MEKEALDYIENVEEVKKILLDCGYYDEETREYVVEITTRNLEPAFKKLFNAKEIIFR